MAAVNPSRYGCSNRRPFVRSYLAQDGWWNDGESRIAKLVEIKTFGQQDCQYTLTQLGQADRRCEGCLWRRKPNGEPWSVTQ